MDGEVKFFNREKNFGFIKSEGKDYYFHGSQYKSQRTPLEFDKVTFDLQDYKGREQAANVKHVENR